MNDFNDEHMNGNTTKNVLKSKQTNMYYLQWKVRANISIHDEESIWIASSDLISEMIYSSSCSQGRILLTLYIMNNMIIMHKKYLKMSKFRPQREPKVKRNIFFCKIIIFFLHLLES